MTDDKIVELFWNRDERAIDETEAKYAHYLTAIAMQIVDDREDALESVNDTYLAAWNAIPPQKPRVLSTFLGKLTRRIAIDVFRRRHRVKRCASEYALSLDELGDCLCAGDSPETTVDAAALGDAIGTFLRTLPDTKRHLFIGRYYYLDPLKTVAAYCGISESKAKTWLFRMRCDLKVYLQQEGFL